MDVTTPQPSRLTVRDACDPGWIARVDGQVAPIACADVLFRSVDIPAGTHRVAFTYEPPAVPLGLALSAAGLVAWLGLGLAAARRQSR